ncbi:MAG: peroxiredoxin [Cocleimonas sp.]|nr:peroxiredoxin [Cocleimonas sp.]
MAVKLGDKLPSFTLNDQNGKAISIDQFIGKKNIVIYFYPKDETSICTAEAQGFRDVYPEFLALDSVIIGISSDSESSHHQFAQHHQLPFILLSDPDKKIETLFAVPKDLFGFISGRVTYIINKKGMVIGLFDHAFSAQKHINSALKSLKVEQKKFNK